MSMGFYLVQCDLETYSIITYHMGFMSYHRTNNYYHYFIHWRRYHSSNTTLVIVIDTFLMIFFAWQINYWTVCSRLNVPHSSQKFKKTSNLFWFISVFCCPTIFQLMILLDWCFSFVIKVLITCTIQSHWNKEGIK